MARPTPISRTACSLELAGRTVGAYPFGAAGLVCEANQYRSGSADAAVSAVALAAFSRLCEGAFSDSCWR